MISIDTNILLPAVERTNVAHRAAAAFLMSLNIRDDVAISEFVLVELYCLLRNPAVLGKPLSASAAVDVCEAFRHHPRWQLLGFPAESRAFHDTFWPRIRDKTFASRTAFDWRLALSLVQQGVTEFATVNKKDFTGFGFAKVWNPIAGHDDAG